MGQAKKGKQFATEKYPRIESRSDVEFGSRFHASLNIGVRNGTLIFLVAICLFLILALSTYSPYDPGFSTTGLYSKVTNIAGSLGAWIASFLFFFFGVTSWLLPVMLANESWKAFQGNFTRHPFEWSLFLFRFSGFLLVLTCSSAMLALYSIAGLGPDAGGVLGASLKGSSLPILNMAGSTLLFISGFLLGITMLTGLSWFSVMDKAGEYTLKLLSITKQGLNKCYIVITKLSKKIFRNMVENNKKTENLSVSEKQSKSVISIGNLWKWVTFFKREQLFPRNDLIEPAFGEIPTLEPEVTLNERLFSESDPIFNNPNKVEVSSIKIEPFVKHSSESLRARREKQGQLFEMDGAILPPITLLDSGDTKPKHGYSEETLAYMSQLLVDKLADFGVIVTVVEVNPGPVITRFEIQPAPGVKVSKITNLVKDLARSMSVISVRVVEIIPGKSVVGIEIPNEHRNIVYFIEALSSREYDESESPLTLALGNDIAGNPIIVNLAKMPHLLVAGTTGSGKSVGVNSMILSMLFKATPDQVRFIFIDPKMLELSIYDGIPHLLTPVVTDMKEAANALRWCVAEMERRYHLMASVGVRNLAGYNRKVKEAIDSSEPLKDPIWKPDELLPKEEQERPDLIVLPFIVVFIDEFADMMMIVGKKVEDLIARIAQKARAAGIHLVLATQRPSVDVITGLIKANVPTRISFQVSSKIDSRTVLDQGGAEQLLGQGDMLYLPPGSGMPVRVHGAFVSDDEVHRVVAYWREQGSPVYVDNILEGADSNDPMVTAITGGGDAEQDVLYDQGVAFVIESRRASISAVQRKLKVGYNRAANLIEAMELAGIISPPEHNGTREVLVPASPEH